MASEEHCREWSVNSVLFTGSLTDRLQSWHPQNLYNLWRRSTVKKQESVFTETTQTLFQQRWIAKRLTRAYHGDFINEKIFKRWYLPDNLPDVRPRRKAPGDDTEALAAFALQDRRAEGEKRRREEEDRQALAPVGSLMFTEVERRIDVFIFRCCFAHSVYEARRMVIHGNVLLNGKKVCTFSSPDPRLIFISISRSTKMRIHVLLLGTWFL